MATTPRLDVIAIGGSAGSHAVLKQVLHELTPELPATVLISTHVPAHGSSRLAEVLQATSSIPVTQAVDGQPVEYGHVYIAAPDRHLLMIDGVLRLGVGPRENMVRPSIDPLFRSAALSCGSSVIGVVLSGMLNDGAAGLNAIKSVGGTTIVQHPLDAEADDMPLAALNATDVDHVVQGAYLAGLLGELAGSVAPPRRAPTEELRLEVEIAAGGHVGSDTLMRFARPSTLTCPDCHGVLSEVQGSRPLRYRCQIGHAYTAEAVASHTHEVDEAVRVALRVMEERVTLVERMALDARQTGRSAVAELYEMRALEYRRYAVTLREAALMSLRRVRSDEGAVS